MPRELNPFEVQWTKANDAQFRRVISDPRALAALFAALAPDAMFWRGRWPEADRGASGGAPVPVSAAEAAGTLERRRWAVLAVDTTPRAGLLNAGLADHSGGHLWTVVDLDAEDEYVLREGPSPHSVLGALNAGT